MKRVGVRQLKNEATQIVREVRENAAEYVITVNGEPVATLRPYEPAAEATDADGAREMDEWLAELDEIGRELARTWPKGLSIVDAIREQRD